MRTRLLSLVSGFISLACSHPASPSAPNIVILLADDLGWADVGYHATRGSAIRTPNIDALAHSSRILDRYRVAPMCTPSRAGLLTARSPLRMGLWANLGDTDVEGVPLDETLLVQRFRDAGYATWMTGKWHLGHARAEQGPNARGFDHFYGHLAGWVDYSTHARNGTLDWQRDGVPVIEDGYATHLIARESVRLIQDRDRAKPFFLYAAFNAPHPPLALPPGRRADEVTEKDPERVAYSLMVEELDRAVGEILAVVEGEGLRENTIVFFASDNGANPRFGGSNAPLRGGKYSAFEGGLRVPALLSWPGRIESGVTMLAMSHLDVLPTLAGAAGIALRTEKPLDGRDLWPALMGSASAAETPLVFGSERPDELRCALILGRWKRVDILKKADGSTHDMLFDLEKDPAEENDVAAAHADVVRDLDSVLAPWKIMPRLALKASDR